MNLYFSFWLEWDPSTGQASPDYLTVLLSTLASAIGASRLPCTRRDHEYFCPTLLGDAGCSGMWGERTGCHRNSSGTILASQQPLDLQPWAAPSRPTTLGILHVPPCWAISCCRHVCCHTTSPGRGWVSEKALPPTRFSTSCVTWHLAPSCLHSKAGSCQLFLSIAAYLAGCGI